MRTHFEPTVKLAIILTTLSGTLSAAEVVTSKESGWPQWRGPRSDNTSAETGLLDTWPEGGPKLLWKSSDIGKGHSSPVISGGSLYISGDRDDRLHVSALDLDGQVKWTVQNGEGWKKNFPGSRSSCTYSEGRVYNMNAHGRLVCLEAADGREIWNISMLDEYASRNIIWGISESPLVVEGKVYITPAGEKALMAALDAKTGREIWRTEALEGDAPVYASAVMLNTAKGRQLVSGSSGHTFGVDAESGRLLWKYPHELEKPVALSPGFTRDSILVSLSIRTGACYYALALDEAANGVTMKWKNEFGNPYGGVTVVGDTVICSSDRISKGWFRIDAETGQIRSRLENLVSGSSIYADGKFYGLCSDGKMVLLDAGGDGLKIVSEFDFIKGQKNVWAYPVICDGRLYLRYDNTLYCYDIGRVKPQGGVQPKE